MADETHSPDTWFIIAEEDYRIYQEDAAPSAGRMADLSMEAAHQSELTHNLDQLYQARLAVCPLRGSPYGGELSAPPEDHVPAGCGFFRKTTKARAEEFEHPSSELVDLLHIATLASRAGQGGLVLYAFDGPANPKRGSKGRRRNVPMHGSTLLGISAAAARVLWQNFDEWFEMHHWDITLFRALEKRGDAEEDWWCMLLLSVSGSLRGAHERHGEHGQDSRLGQVVVPGGDAF